MIKSPFRYSGAKNRLLPTLMPYINKMLIGQKYFCDAFVGGGSVLLEVAEKYPNIQLFANDKDRWISCFWSVVADNNSKKLDTLLGMLDATPTVEQFYKLGQTPPINDIERAYYAIFFNRASHNGFIKRDNQDCIKSNPIGGWGQKSKSKVDCRFNIKTMKEKILYCHKLLSGRTKVDCQDFSSYVTLMQLDYPIYLDPPYLKKGHMLYNEWMKLIEHENLSKILKNRTNWILSYDDHPEIRKFYNGFEVIDLAARYSINGKKNNWAKKNELLITNI